jgi:hypothetical protein
MHPSVEYPAWVIASISLIRRATESRDRDACTIDNSARCVSHSMQVLRETERLPGCRYVDWLKETPALDRRTCAKIDGRNPPTSSHARPIVASLEADVPKVPDRCGTMISRPGIRRSEIPIGAGRELVHLIDRGGGHLRLD